MVSVIIPTYNRQDLVVDSINSVLNQTYSDFELLIVDDGSTDETRSVVESINDSRIRYIYKEHAGACAARNRGIDEAKGEYIAFEDSDDLWHPDKLKKQVEEIIKTDADILFCKLVLKYEDGSVHYWPEGFESGFITKETSLFGIGTQTLLGKAKVFKENKFDEDMPRFQELELLLRLVQKNSIYCFNEGLVDYRVRGDSISSDDEKLYKAVEIILKKDYEYISANRSTMNEMINILISKARKCDTHYKEEFEKYRTEAENCWSTIRELQEINKRLSDEYGEVLNSTCWKITKPVRAVLDFLKRS